jgi:hypothetical protein
VYANLVAAGAYEQHGRPEEQRAALAQAGRDVQALERVRQLPVASAARVIYFREVGDHAAALSEALGRQRSGTRLSGYDEFLLGMELYHHEEFRQALDVFDRGTTRGGDTSCFQFFRCYVLAELPDGPARALTAYRGLTLSGVYEIYGPTILQLLGRQSEAVDAYRALREKALKVPARPEWLDRLLEYNAGLLQADKLLAAAVSSRLNLCEAHFFIGLTLLADGDRAGARDHFRRSAAAHVIWFVEHWWSLAFLSRMEKDPTWPPWIALKE